MLDSEPATNSEFSIKYVAYLHWVALFSGTSIVYVQK